MFDETQRADVASSVFVSTTGRRAAIAAGSGRADMATPFYGDFLIHVRLYSILEVPAKSTTVADLVALFRATVNEPTTAMREFYLENPRLLQLRAGSRLKG